MSNARMRPASPLGSRDPAREYGARNVAEDSLPEGASAHAGQLSRKTSEQLARVQDLLSRKQARICAEAKERNHMTFAALSVIVIVLSSVVSILDALFRFICG